LQHWSPLLAKIDAAPAARHIPRNHRRRQMLASEVMTRNIVTIGRDAPIRDAIRLMLDNKVSGLPVVDARDKMIGILTEGDLLHRSEIATEKHHWRWLEFVLGPGRMASEYVKTHGRLVGELMTREVVTIGVDTPLGDIVALMEHHHVKRLPVIDNGKLAGIVSRADLLAALGKALDAQAVPAASDEDIRARILAELEKVEWAPRDGLTIAVADGVVELSGVVFDEHERAALRVAAENIPGVKGISDRLVWVEPVSGTVIEATQEAPQTIAPRPR
jgi:CBS-domain-containing membrane protein